MWTRVFYSRSSIIRAGLSGYLRYFLVIWVLIYVVKISNFYKDIFILDEEYFALMLSEFIAIILNKIYKAELMEATIKYSYKVNDSLPEFLKANDEKSLAKSILK